MQRVTNCVLAVDDKILMLQKPSRGWWVAPGGKMESGESIKESVDREFREETGMRLQDAKLRTVFTMVVMDNDEVIREWMMFTFQAREYEGLMLEQSPEGFLEWKHAEELDQLPMAAGDRFIFRHILTGQGIMYGTFYYTPDFDLLSYRLEPDYK
ncbi:8-oxo-dGTP diphosphatase [bacterium LRH843]|nr:8-oxo-dGTP diphosphatase [bacterium LRH843]